MRLLTTRKSDALKALMEMFFCPGIFARQLNASARRKASQEFSSQKQNPPIADFGGF